MKVPVCSKCGCEYVKVHDENNELLKWRSMCDCKPRKAIVKNK